MCTESKQGWCN